MKKILQIFGVGAVFLVFVFLVGYSISKINTAKASVADGNNYYSTTTKAAGGVALPSQSAIKPGPGALGSVVITGTAAGVMNFYDATTSDATKRTNPATTTIATFAASVAAGTYTFDATFNYGLLYETTGTAPTSTITYR